MVARDTTEPGRRPGRGAGCSASMIVVACALLAPVVLLTATPGSAGSAVTKESLEQKIAELQAKLQELQGIESQRQGVLGAINNIDLAAVSVDPSGEVTLCPAERKAGVEMAAKGNQARDKANIVGQEYNATKASLTEEQRAAKRAEYDRFVAEMDDAKEKLPELKKAYQECKTKMLQSLRDLYPVYYEGDAEALARKPSDDTLAHMIQDIKSDSTSFDAKKTYIGDDIGKLQKSINNIPVAIANLNSQIKYLFESSIALADRETLIARCVKKNEYVKIVRDPDKVRSPPYLSCEMPKFLQ